MPKPDKKELEKKARMEFEKLLPMMVAKLSEFTERPGAITLLESEKGLNVILDEVGDSIMAEVVKNTAEAKEVSDTAVEAFKKNTENTIRGGNSQSSFGMENPLL
jgi:hypothetical protein